MYRSLLIGISLAGLALAVATPAHADDWSKKYSVSGKPELRVETDDGDVQISTGAANEISAHVSTSGYKIGPNDVHIIESQDGNHIQLLVKGPHHMFTFNMGHHSISVQLQVPAQTDLDIHTGDGNVSSSAISGRVQVDTGDGNINSNGLHGDIHLHTGDGHVDGTDFDGNLLVDTGDGHVTVTGRFDSLSLKSGDGSIAAEVHTGSKIASTWMLRTGDGRIDLKLPDGFNADLDAHTGDGHISLDFPVMVSGSLSESRVRGKMNGGGGTLELTSGDGSIRIEKL
ncbi:MAG: DUF4097 family beta strand repeat-containing protein [Candidatus Acidiferrales bacterium]